MNTKENYKIVLNNPSSTFSYDNIDYINVISVDDINNLVNSVNDYIDILSGMQTEDFCQFVTDPYTYIETVTDCTFPRVKYFNDTTENIKVVKSDSTINNLPLSSTNFNLMVQNESNPITFVTSINGSTGNINGIQYIKINNEIYNYTESNQGVVNLRNLLTGNTYLKSINDCSGKLFLPSGVTYKDKTITCNSNGVLNLSNLVNSYLNVSNKTFNTLYVENVDENDPKSVINLKYFNDHRDSLRVNSYSIELSAENISNDQLTANIPVINDTNFVSYIYGIQDGEYKKIVGYDTNGQGNNSFEIDLYKKGIPLTFTLLEGVANATYTLKLYSEGQPGSVALQYSLNYSVYTNFPANGVTLKLGDVISLSGSGSSFSIDSANYYRFDIENATKFVCYGNVMSLVNWATEITTPNQFYGLFVNSKIVKAPELPATVLTQGCYSSMFYHCNNLVVPPILPATNLKECCYKNMFEGCISLSTIPILPAVTLAQGCYNEMFKDCTSLTMIPYYQLPATELNENCYKGMFENCTNITDGPLLPATTLVNNCYDNIFKNCTGLTAIHADLSLEDIIDNYTSGWLDGVSNATFYNTEAWNMCKQSNLECFYYNNTNILSNAIRIARSLQDTPLSFELISGATDGAFCFRSLQYNLSKKTYKNHYYSTKDDKSKVINMNTKFKYYNSSNYQLTGNVKKMDSDGWITQSFTWKTEGSNYTLTHDKYPFNDTTSGKNGLIFSLKSDYFSPGLNKDKTKIIFWRLCHNTKNCKFKIMGNIKSLIGGRDEVKPYQLFSLFSNISCGSNHYANGYVDAHQLILPSKVLGKDCYLGMFEGCNGLVNGPLDLPATTLEEECYARMFAGCTSLQRSPNIQAKNLATSCCREMFDECTELNLPPSINNINYTAKNCFNSMFNNCGNIKYYQDLNTTTIEQNSYIKMFDNCNDLLYPPSLNSKTVGMSGCSYMFEWCSKLTYIPPLLMNTLDSYCYKNMFNNCTHVAGKHVYLPASKLKTGCYQYMFRKVPISGIAVKFNAWSDNNMSTTNTSNWLNSVLSAGNFYCYPQLNTNNRGVHTVPLNWTVYKSIKGVNLTFRDTITVGDIQLFYLRKNNN